MNEEDEHKRNVKKYKQLNKLIEQEEEIDVDWGKDGYETGRNLVYRKTLLKINSKILKQMITKMDPESTKYQIIALILQRRHFNRKPIK